MDAKAQCPLCQLEMSSLTQLLRHLGKHHEELSLFALPSRMKVDDESEADDVGDDDDSQPSVAGNEQSVGMSDNAGRSYGINDWVNESHASAEMDDPDETPVTIDGIREISSAMVHLVSVQDENIYYRETKTHPKQVLASLNMIEGPSISGGTIQLKERGLRVWLSLTATDESRVAALLNKLLRANDTRLLREAVAKVQDASSEDQVQSDVNSIGTNEVDASHNEIRMVGSSSHEQLPTISESIIANVRGLPHRYTATQCNVSFPRDALVIHDLEDSETDPFVFSSEDLQQWVVQGRTVRLEVFMDVHIGGTTFARGISPISITPQDDRSSWLVGVLEKLKAASRQVGVKSVASQEQGSYGHDIASAQDYGIQDGGMPELSSDDHMSKFIHDQPAEKPNFTAKEESPLFSLAVEAFYGSTETWPPPYVRSHLKLYSDFFSVDLDFIWRWEYENIDRIYYMRTDIGIVKKDGRVERIIRIRTADPSDMYKIVQVLRTTRPELVVAVEDIPDWTYHERQDLEAGIASFGTDWPVIADGIFSKTAKLVEEEYHRLITEGRTDLEQLAREVDLRRARIGKRSTMVTDKSVPRGGASVSKSDSADEHPEGLAQDPAKSDADEVITAKDDSDPSNDRWAQIREKAAERAARLRNKQSTRDDTGTHDHDKNATDAETDDEETIASRVAWIKARVAELTGNIDATSSESLKKGYVAQGRSYASAEHVKDEVVTADEDNKVLEGDEEKSNAHDDNTDEGFQADEETSFAVSDSDSDAGSDYNWWTPGASTAVPEVAATDNNAVAERHSVSHPTDDSDPQGSDHRDIHAPGGNKGQKSLRKAAVLERIRSRAGFIKEGPSQQANQAMERTNLAVDETKSVGGPNAPHRPRDMLTNDENESVQQFFESDRPLVVGAGSALLEGDEDGSRRENEPPLGEDLLEELYKRPGKLAEEIRLGMATKVLFTTVTTCAYDGRLDGLTDGHPYLIIAPDRTFDVVSTKGDLWLAREQKLPAGPLGWIWSKHCLNSGLDNALNYRDLVKAQFPDRPDVRKQFINILRDFESGANDTPVVIERVTTLFAGNSNLILGFNTFLPAGYKIECIGDSGTIRVTTPMGATVTTVPPHSEVTGRTLDTDGVAQHHDVSSNISLQPSFDRADKNDVELSIPKHGDDSLSPVDEVHSDSDGERATLDLESFNDQPSTSSDPDLPFEPLNVPRTVAQALGLSDRKDLSEWTKKFREASGEEEEGHEDRDEKDAELDDEALGEQSSGELEHVETSSTILLTTRATKSACQHSDVRAFEGMHTCLSCGESLQEVDPTHQRSELARVLDRTRLASDPRDRISSLLGIINSGLVQPVKPDYSKGMDEVVREMKASLTTRWVTTGTPPDSHKILANLDGLLAESLDSRRDTKRKDIESDTQNYFPQEYETEDRGPWGSIPKVPIINNDSGEPTGAASTTAGSTPRPSGTIFSAEVATCEHCNAVFTGEYQRHNLSVHVYEEHGKSTIDEDVARMELTEQRSRR